MNSVRQMIFIAQDYLDLDISFCDPDVFHLYVKRNADKNNFYVDPVAVLWQNREGFKRRMIHGDDDNFITKERFHPIAFNCWIILSTLSIKFPLEEWQVSLMELFKSFGDDV